MQTKKKINIVYEDDYLLIVNKPSGTLVHKTTFNENDTLYDFLENYFKNKKINYENLERMGICHRIDKDTEGLIIVAKDKKTKKEIQKLIEEKKISRKYLAIIVGQLKTKVVKVNVPLKRLKNKTTQVPSSDYDAKEAISFFKEIEVLKGYSLIECELITGRTHQIRAHLKYIKNYLINDPVYGNNKKTTSYGQYLAANEISFFHPKIKNKFIHIKLEMPQEFQKFIKEHK